MAVQQTGSITPGHLAAWTAEGVIGDGGAFPGAEKVLASAVVDMMSTADQPLILPARMQAFMLTRIIGTNSAVSLATATGGIYPAASKAGTPLVAASQAYSSLNAITKLLSLTLASAVATTRYSRTNLADWALYFSLTTGQSSAATMDLYVCGIDLTGFTQ